MHEIRSHRAPSKRHLFRAAALAAVVGLIFVASPAEAQSRQAQPRVTQAAAVSNLPVFVQTVKRWWTQPVVGAGCSSPFNQLRTDSGTYRHAGRDLTRYEGAPVRAVANGKVVRVTAPSGYLGGYGYRVQIRHGKGQYETLYAHLQRGSITVHVGQWVRMGVVIGRMGHTGWAYGTHTHFEVRSWGTPINPDVFMRNKGVKLC